MEEKDPISEQIIDLYKQDSSFGFEIKVVNKLRHWKYEVKHGGFYRDRVTGKYRQFDIWAGQRVESSGDGVFLSVECKNLSSSIIVATTPRELSESHHWVFDNERGCVLEIKNCPSIQPEKPVGRTIEPVKIDASGNLQRVGRDDDPYERYIQAISSSADLIDFAKSSFGKLKRIIVLPFLVIPDNKLWTAEYDRAGKLARVDRAKVATYYMNIPVEDNHPIQDYRHSHLWIATVSGFEEIISYFKTLEGRNVDNWFG